MTSHPCHNIHYYHNKCIREHKATLSCISKLEEDNFATKHVDVEEVLLKQCI